MAQALVNERADGAPELILATPPIPLAAASESPTDADVQMHVLASLRACIAAFVDACGDSAEAKILIHLEAAGFDRSDLTPTLSALVEFLESRR
nr:hypothetical protein Ade03nite_94840 [Actinoplanes derwentensis]